MFEKVDPPMAAELTGSELPSPIQMRNYLAAQDAAVRARQMLEASKALIFGNVAASLGVAGFCLVFIHSDWYRNIAPFLLCGVVYGYLALAVWSFRVLKKRTRINGPHVVGRLERDAALAPPTAARRAVILTALLLIVFLMTGLMIFFLPKMPETAIIALLCLTPIMGGTLFVVRFAMFRFWEYLLFAFGIVLAFAPFPFKAWEWMPLSFASLILPAIGTWSLDRRWRNWIASIEDSPGETHSENSP
jgi:hypothetical protein